MITLARGSSHQTAFAATVAALLCSLASTLAAAQAAVVARVSVEPNAPIAYDPFNVRVVFSAPLCFSVTSPVYSSVSFKNGVLSLVLSHLKPGPCVSERILPVSGLPAGTHSIRLSITSRVASASGTGFYGGITDETQVGSTTLIVAARPELKVGNVYTAKVSGDGIYQPFTETEGGGGPVVLWLQHGEPVSGGGDWLDVGSPAAEGYTFKAFNSNTAITVSALPAAYEPLFFFRYPVPYQGYFAVTSAECVQLVRTWGARPNATSCPAAFFFALKYRNGSCPLGATPVYRLFHPVSIAHRYTQSADTYSELQNYGFIGEGPVFCAPAR